MSLRFKVYYGDLSTYDGDPYYAPRRNVQVIVGPSRSLGRYTVSRMDAYWWDADCGRWFGGDRNGEFDYMLELGPRVVLYGRFIDDDVYNDCMKAALADPDFPPKSARGWKEPPR